DGDKITSAELVDRLKEIETSPWGDWGRGKGLTKNGLSKLLKPFGIRPHGTIRIDDKTAKGYVRESFQDAFERYLTREAARSGSANVTTSQPASIQTKSEFSETSRKPFVTFETSAPDPHKHCIVTDVTVEKSPRAGLDTNEADIATLPSCPKCGSFALYREK